MICGYYSCLMSQSVIEGKVAAEQGDPIAYCNLGLMNASDSSVVTGNITSESGVFVFQNVKPGRYFVRVNAIGFKVYDSDPFSVDSLTKLSLSPFLLVADAVNLNEVSVSVLKKPVEFKNGNIVVNVEGSPLAVGNTVYDLLVRMPGVLIDGDNITIQGKGGARILIDNRMQQLAGSQIINLLKSMNASGVDKIEIISNPSAKYDAAGSGGLINITTKKVKITGFSGSLMLNYSQGFYARNFGELALNYKGKKFNVFTNYNGNYAEYRSVNDWHRVVKNDSLITRLDQHYLEKTTSQYVSLFAGADWYADKRSTFSLRASLRPGNDKTIRHATTSLSNDAPGYSNLSFDFVKPSSWFWQDYSLNYEFFSDTSKTKLTLNASYSIYPDNYKASYSNNYLGNDFTDVMPVKIFRSTNSVQISAAAARADFEKTFKNKLRVEAGVKLSEQNMLSDFRFENLDNSTGLYVTDSSLSNRFQYNEKIQAAYTEVNKEFKKFNFVFGLRAENTVIKADSKDKGIGYDRSYFNLFPVSNITYNHSDKHNLQLSYNRRINRADYNNFNPYRAFRSVLTYVQGNPYLNPQYTDRIECRHTYKSKLSNSISWAGMSNYFFSYNKENVKTNELIFMTGNLKHADIFSYVLFWQSDLFKWWTISTNLGAHYFRCSGNVDGKFYSTGAFNSNVYMFHQFALSKNTKAEISFWGAGPWKDGVTLFKSRGELSVGFRQTLLKEKLTISLGVQDVLFTSPVVTVIDYNGQYSDSYHRWDSRRAYFSLNYNFGKIKVQQKNIKDNDEVKGRLKK